MGYIRHHAIVVTAFEKLVLDDAMHKARELGMAITNAVRSPINGYVSFFVAPDGSKEGWENSDIGDKQRSDFVQYMDSKRYTDGSNLLHWVEIEYGGDGRDAKVVNHNWSFPLKVREERHG